MERASAVFRATPALPAVFAACAVVATVAVVGAASSPAEAQCECDAMAIEAIGHRGTGVDADDNAFAENTIPSFLEAAREGATMVELDVQHSADGALIVIHDDTVDRTTDGTGCVGDLTLAELQALDAGGSQLPTLEEVFAAVDVEVGINVEIKMQERERCPETDRARLGADVAAVIAADAAGSTGGAQREVLVSCFDLEQLLAVRAADETVELAYLIFGGDDFQVAVDQGFRAVHPLAVGTRPMDVALAQEAGLLVNPWTVNDVPTMHRLADMGVDRIITDAPEVVPEAMRSYCAALVCGDAGVDGSVDGGPDGGSPDGGGDAGFDSGSDEGAGGGGCSATSSGQPRSPAAPVAVALALLALVRRRRRGYRPLS